ncbi:MAG: hypothetical protein NZM12_10520, partial [Steroidobacteraceae bacterium]|nr:hypothetical protein [Steroidobacteraceae bacterium]MDW8260126.1 hypothetical protein [Gammaproteobacteria bacterium]
SAHVYLGTVLLLVVTLHSGFQFGWNIHTLCYALTCAVIATGMVGVGLYLMFPRQLSAVQAGLTVEQLLGQIRELDERSGKVAARLPPEYADIVKSNRDRLALGGSVRALLFGLDRSQVLLPGPHGTSVLQPNPRQERLVQFLNERLSLSTDGNLSQALAELLSLVIARQSLIVRLLRQAQIKAWLQIWLYLHVPLTFALLASLVAHVFSVFYYW